MDKAQGDRLIAGFDNDTMDKAQGDRLIAEVDNNKMDKAQGFSKMTNSFNYNKMTQWIRHKESA